MRGVAVLQLSNSHAPYPGLYRPLFRDLQRRHAMKLLSAVLILLIASVSGVALPADGQPVGGAGSILQTRYTGIHVLGVNSGRKSVDLDSIRCACMVPMTYA